MFQFLRKKKPEQEITIPELPKECIHKWRDFAWYINDSYDFSTGYLKIEIIEPYVCIHCKKRENVSLVSIKWNGLTGEEIRDKIKAYDERYADKLRPRAEIEDEINDFQRVDRLYLQIADSLWPDRRIMPSEEQSV